MIPLKYALNYCSLSSLLTTLYTVLFKVKHYNIQRFQICCLVVLCLPGLKIPHDVN